MALWQSVTIIPCFISIVFGLTNPSMQDALDALEKVIHFYKSNYKNTNLDGIFGLKILEGQLGPIIEDHADGQYPHLSSEVVNRLKRLKHDAEGISSGAIPFLKKLEPDYYKQMHFVVEYPWQAWKSPRKLDHTLKWNKDKLDKTVEDIDEKTSDRCFSELFSAGKLRQSCQPTDRCLATMIGARGLTEYAITHQLLYSQMVEQIGCGRPLNRWLEEHKRPGGLHHMQHEFCSNIRHTMQEKLKLSKGVVLPYYQDLVMEEVFVCGSLGFREFLQDSILEQILSWQKPSGCFGTMPRPSLPNISHIDYEYQDEDDINMQQKMADVYLQRPLKKQENAQYKKQDNLSPYELFKLAHAPGIKDSVTEKPVAVVLNRNNMKVVDDQLVHETILPENNMQVDPNVHLGGQHAQLQKPPPHRAEDGNDAKNVLHRPPVGQGHQPVLKSVNRNENDQPSNRNLGDLKLNGQLSRHTRSELNAGLGMMKDSGLANRAREKADHGAGDVYQEGELEEDDEEDGDDMKLRGRIGNRRKLLYEKTLADGCLSHKTAVAVAALSIYTHHFVEVTRAETLLKDKRNKPLHHGHDQETPKSKQQRREILRGGVQKNAPATTAGKISLRKVIGGSVETGRNGQNAVKPPRRGDQDVGVDYAEDNDDYQGYAHHEDESRDDYNDNNDHENNEHKQAKLFVGQKTPIKKNVLDRDNDQYGEEQYDRYYYEGDEEGKKHAVDKNKDILIVENAKQEEKLRSHKAVEPILNQNNIPTTHLFVFSFITLVLLCFMYRFIRKRRLLIRYPFSGR